MLRSLRFFSVLFVLGLSLYAKQAQAQQVGLGIVLGDPTGLSAKFLLDQRSAIDLAFGADLDNDDDLQIHFDYLFSPATIAQSGGVTIPFYFGIGGVVEIDNDNNNNDDADIGLRVPVGLSFLFSRAPVEVFVEAGLEILLIEDNNDEVDFDAGLGFRYYF
jgi:hypothetical protein